jgi:chaperonin GroEL
MTKNTKQFLNKRELREKILTGANKLADNVASTLGPKGRNVILAKGNKMTITKDGVSVAKFIDLEDPFENLGAQAIKQASAKTNQDAGDGTTTATVLSRELLMGIQRHLLPDISPVELKRGMDKACQKVLDNLDEIANSIKTKEDIENIATISANGDKTIGSLIAHAVDLVGKDGSITIEDARSFDTSLELVEGFRVPAGFVSTKFVTDDVRNIVKYENSYLLVTDSKIESVEELLPTLELVARESRPLVVVADQIEGQALAALIMNAMRGSMKVAAVKAPFYGEERRSLLNDLAVSTGATFITQEEGKRLKDVTLKDLGLVKSVEINKFNSTFVGGHGQDIHIERRIEQIKEEIKQTEDLSVCERLQERITRLSSGVAIIKVGAATELEATEKRHRIVDALEAVRAAQKGGILPGGGTALIRATSNKKDFKDLADNEDQQLGVNCLLACVSGPLKQMARNGGLSPDVILSQVKRAKGNNGFNFYTEKVENLLKSGVIDPALVTKSALANAVSVVSTLITTDYAIVEVEDAG